MSEERLIEIMSTISVLNGPFMIIGYLATLNENEINYITDCVRNFGYGKGSNFYKSLKSFAEFYINGKNVVVDDEFLKEFGYKKEYVGETSPKRK